VHSGELRGEWCRLDVTGGLNGKEILVGERNWETVDCRRVHSRELHRECC